MAEKSEAQQRRDRQIDAAEARALSGQPQAKQQPQEKPSGFFETARKALFGTGAKHNVDGKQQERP